MVIIPIVCCNVPGTWLPVPASIGIILFFLVLELGFVILDLPSLLDVRKQPLGSDPSIVWAVTLSSLPSSLECRPKKDITLENKTTLNRSWKRS